MAEPARRRSLIERVEGASAPHRSFFAEAFYACAGRQHPNIKARYAMLVDAKAWTEAALVLTACALPGWRVHSGSRHGYGEATLFPPNADGTMGMTPRPPVAHAGGDALAILLAVMQAVIERSASRTTR